MDFGDVGAEGHERLIGAGRCGSELRGEGDAAGDTRTGSIAPGAGGGLGARDRHDGESDKTSRAKTKTHEEDRGDAHVTHGQGPAAWLENRH